MDYLEIVHPFFKGEVKMQQKQNIMDKLDNKRDEVAAKLVLKEFKFPTEIVSGVVFLLLALICYLLIPSQIQISETDQVNGRVFPYLLVAIMGVFSFILIGKELVNVYVKKKPWTTKTINLLEEVRALFIFVILILTYVISKVTNLFLLGAIFCSIGFLVFFRCRKISYYVITLGLAVLIWVSFRFGLNVGF